MSKFMIVTPQNRLSRCSYLLFTTSNTIVFFSSFFPPLFSFFVFVKCASFTPVEQRKCLFSSHFLGYSTSRGNFTYVQHDARWDTQVYVRAS